MKSYLVLVLVGCARTNMRTLEDVIREQSMFEDSALEDASAYARMVNNGAKRFQRKEFSIFKAVEDGMKLSVQQSIGKLNDTRSKSKEASQENIR